MELNPNINQTSSVFKTFENKQNTPTKTTQPAKKGINKKVVLAGTVALGAITIGGLIAAGKIKQAKKLAEHIDFKEAKTLEEAAEFAKNHFHIKKFNLTNLDCANYVNEGLTTYSNMHKGKVKLPKAVLTTLDDCGMGVNSFNELSVNEKSMCESITDIAKDLSEKILKNKKIINFTDEELSLLEKCLNGSKLSFKENLKLTGICTYNGQNNPISFLYKSDKLPEILKSHPTLPKTFAEFELLKGKELEAATKELASVYTKTGFKGELTKVSDFYHLFHELGHNQHRFNIGNKAFDKLNVIMRNNIQDKFDWTKVNTCEQKATGLVSHYSKTSPGEFVAETYAALLSGSKFSDEIMDLYKKYGGPAIQI